MRGITNFNFILLFCKVCVQKTTFLPFLSTAVSLYESLAACILFPFLSLLLEHIGARHLPVDSSFLIYLNRNLPFCGRKVRSLHLMPLILMSSSSHSWILKAFVCNHWRGSKESVHCRFLQNHSFTPSRNANCWIPALICPSMEAVGDSEHPTCAILM